MIFIVDNLMVHHANTVNAWLSRHKHRIKMFCLPSYSRLLNPKMNRVANLKRGVKPYLNNNLKPNLSRNCAPKKKL